MYSIYGIHVEQTKTFKNFKNRSVTPSPKNSATLKTDPAISLVEFDTKVRRAKHVFWTDLSVVFIECLCVGGCEVRAAGTVLL